MRINKLFHRLSGDAAIVYSLLAFMLFGGSHVAWACPDLPDTISLPGSTFIEERISVERSAGKKDRGGHTIHFGKTALTHNGRCWHSITHRKCLSELLTGNYKRIMITKNNVKVGLLEFNDRERAFQVYSVHPGGQKAAKAPYLSFKDEVVYRRQSHGLLPSGNSSSSSRRVDMRISEYKLKVFAYDRGRRVGQYESVSLPGGSISRGIGAAPAKKTGPAGAVSLRGKNVSARYCHVDVRRI